MSRRVDQVAFDLRKGETLGSSAKAASAKTTCARTILRALSPTSGSAIFHYDGKSVDLATLPQDQLKPLRQKMQMIFQDLFSSLNPRMTVGDIIAEPLVIHKLASGKKILDARRCC